ncbi:MAG: class I SAM-dependent methyltransferase [Thermoplasmata archaeon]
MPESTLSSVGRRLHHLAAHPWLWARYLYERELRGRDVLFRVNPRFAHWGPMYRVARPALARLTGRPGAELDGYFRELAPLHRELTDSVGGLPSAGAMMQAPLLYVLFRASAPRVVVETGVSSGYSARLVLEALERNGSGRLFSIGLRKLAVGTIDAASAAGLEGRPLGWLVPDRLRPRWELRVGPSEELLEEVLAREARPLDAFVHDSLHVYERMHAEYELAWPNLLPGGLLLSHDIHHNRAWPNLLRDHALSGEEELDHDLGVVRVPSPPARLPAEATGGGPEVAPGSAGGRTTGPRTGFA